eukprot:IDg7571t1
MLPLIAFFVWFYRTPREAEYDIRLRALVKSYPKFSNRVSAEPHLLCMGTRFRRTFRFILHGRASRLNEHDVHAKHNEHFRETAYFMASYKIFCDYRNMEADLLSDDRLAAFYLSMSPFWMSCLSYRHSAFYRSMPLSLMYWAQHLADSKPHKSLSWAITDTERVALIA